MTKVAFIGLGRMGHGMAGRYLDAGFAVAVWNRSKAKAEDLIARGARWASSPADAADGADAVVTMVADDEASRAVWLGKDGAAATMKAGSLAIECSTVSHQHALDMARELRGRGLVYIDCPVTGLPQAAAAGKLTLLVGADAGRSRSRKTLSRADRRRDQAFRRGRHRHGLQADQQSDGRGADREPRRRHRDGRAGRARHEPGGGSDGDRRGGEPAGDPAFQAHGGARFLRRVVHGGASPQGCGLRGETGREPAAPTRRWSAVPRSRPTPGQRPRCPTTTKAG